MMCDNILAFFANVHYEGPLPEGISIMNPYRESPIVRELCALFYQKFYADSQPRTLILGINPGRLGGGATGIPFTDTKRLNVDCGIPFSGFTTHEPSSAFIYEMIHAFGGPHLFYSHFYINSACPLGFVQVRGEKMLNYNYYDSPALEGCVREFMVENIRSQIALAGKSERCYCLGTGKNYQYLSKLNARFHFFEELIPLEHPRYIMQYKQKKKQDYIDDYLQKLHLST
jgi:hypothetical protein